MHRVGIALLLMAACAKHEVRPAPDAPVTLEPVAVEASEASAVPGAPEGCVAKYFVRAGRSSCPAAESPPTDVIQGQVGDAAPEGSRCWLSCLGADPWATWGLAVPAPGFRGAVTCRVEAGGQMTFDVVDPDIGVSPSAGATWLTKIGGDAYAWDMRTGRTYVTANACPAGQPSRP